jgi:2-polyprenyl-6-methoxyphenol hydroxylase-like FAD-dependent oxidoreductase
MTTYVLVGGAWPGGFEQDETGVDVELSDGQSLRAEYLVGAMADAV